MIIELPIKVLSILPGSLPYIAGTGLYEWSRQSCSTGRVASTGDTAWGSSPPSSGWPAAACTPPGWSSGRRPAPPVPPGPPSTLSPPSYCPEVTAFTLELSHSPVEQSVAADHDMLGGRTAITLPWARSIAINFWSLGGSDHNHNWAALVQLYFFTCPLLGVINP